MTYKPKIIAAPYFTHHFGEESIRRRQGLLRLYENNIEQTEHNLKLHVEENRNPDIKWLEHVGSRNLWLKADVIHFKRVLYFDLFVSKLKFWKKLHRNKLKRVSKRDPVVSFVSLK